MKRKKFFAFFSTAILGATFLKANPHSLFAGKKHKNTQNSVKVKVNPHAVNRDKTRRQNG